MAQFFTDDQRPDLVRRYVDEAEDVWPTHMQFVYHDPVCEAFWPRLKEEFPAYQFIVYDDSEDRFLAQGNTSLSYVKPPRRNEPRRQMRHRRGVLGRRRRTVFA